MADSVRGFELVERVAEGGYGVVWRGVQASVGREVAVKVIRADLASDAAFVERFRQEAALVARLEHPHVVPLIDFWDDETGAYLVMRWFGHGSLADRLADQGQLALDDAVGVVEQICGGLRFAHRHGVVHRDIKPGNVLLDAEGNAYVTDFGIAKDVEATTQLTATGQGSMGSPVYMAPEQLEGNPVTAATDVYALGILLYEVLSGCKPFSGDTLAAILLASLRETVPSVCEARPELPVAVDGVIQRATAKAPADRYAGVDEFIAALRGAVTPTRVATVTTTNLPESLSSFVGREAELAAVEAMLDANRLVTLTGVGGTGKTRLGLEAAANRIGRHADGVWLVELAPLADPSLVLNEIADTWTLREGEAPSLADVVIGYLAARDVLLVVDNCEHLLEPVVDVLRPLLAAAPGLTVLATSRESLGIDGESVFHVPSLGLPEDEAHAADSEAVRLFVDRVRNTRPDFDPSSEDLGHIARICTRLDGIPLGLELAAARLRTLGPSQLADRLESSFRILTTTQKGAVPRQKTLAATIEWSHDLLTPAEQAVFRRMAVFAGGFDLEAAEAVCAGGEIEAWRILDLVDQLVDKSLVVVAHGPDGAARYRLFEPIREYAAERLAAADPNGSAVGAHARFYADLAHTAEPHIRGPRQIEWARRLDLEYDNLRAAFATLRRIGDVDAYLAMCFDLAWYWQHDGLNHEGVEMVLGAVEDGDADPRKAVRAWWTAAMLGFDIGDPSSVGHADRGLALATELGNLHLIGWMKMVLGAAIRTTPTDRGESASLVGEGYELVSAHPEPPWFDRDWDEAFREMYLGSYGPPGPDRQERYQKAIDGFRRVGDMAMTATALFVTQFLGAEADPEWVFSSLTEAVGISRRTGYRQALGHSLYGWGALARSHGHAEDAHSALVEAAEILSEVGDTHCSTGALAHTVLEDAFLGRLDEARTTLAEVIPTVLSQPQRGRLGLEAKAYALVLAMELGDVERAGWLAGSLEDAYDDPYLGTSDLALALRTEQLAAALPSGQFARLAAEGAAQTEDEVLSGILDWVTNG